MHIRNIFHIIAPFALRMACSDFGYRSALVSSVITCIAVLESRKEGVIGTFNYHIATPIRYNLISSFCYNGMSNIILDDTVRFGAANAFATLLLDRNDGYEDRKDNELIMKCSAILCATFISYQGYSLMLGNNILAKFIMHSLFRSIPIFVFLDTEDKSGNKKSIARRLEEALYISTSSVMNDIGYNFLLPIDTQSPIRLILEDSFVEKLKKFMDPCIDEFTFAIPIMK